MAYDKKCYDLARYFLEECGPLRAKEMIQLAQSIQDFVEQEVQDIMADRDAERQAAYDDYVESKLDQWREEGGPKPHIKPFRRESNV